MAELAAACCNCMRHSGHYVCLAQLSWPSSSSCNLILLPEPLCVARLLSWPPSYAHKAVTKMASRKSEVDFWFVAGTSHFSIYHLSWIDPSDTEEIHICMAALTEESLQQHDADLEDCPQVCGSTASLGLLPQQGL